MNAMTGTLLAGILGLSAAAGRAASGAVSPELDAAITTANTEWAAAMKTGDAKAIAAPYRGDAVFVGVDGTCTRGRAAIEELYRERFRRNGLAVSTRIERRNLVVDGELAYESGYGEVGVMKDGKPATSGGRYLTVWRRGDEGRWMILRNVVLP